jgi:hypothetical protein
MRALIIKSTIRVLAAIALFIIAGLSAVVCSASYGPHKRRENIPREAVDACKNKNLGDPVKVTLSRGKKIDAVCSQFEGDNYLVAVPESYLRKLQSDKAATNGLNEANSNSNNRL